MARPVIVGFTIGILLGVLIPRLSPPLAIQGKQAGTARKAVASMPPGQRQTVELPILGIKTYELPPGKGVTRDNAGKVAKGMTAKEIGDILGGPPGDLTWKRRSFECRWQGRFPAEGDYLDFWMDDNGVLQVLFGKDGRAKSWQFLPWGTNQN